MDKKVDRLEKFSFSNSLIPLTNVSIKLDEVIKPITDLQFDLSSAIKPLSDLQFDLSSAIKPITDQVQPNLLQSITEMSTKLDTAIKPLSDLQFDLSSAIKPLSDLQFDLSSAIKPLSEIGNKIDESLKPVNELGINIEQHFPNLVKVNTKIEEKLRPIIEVSTKLDTAIKPLSDLQFDLSSAIKPLSDLQFDLSSAIKPITDQVQPNLLQSITEMSAKLDEVIQPITKISTKLDDVIKPLGNLRIDLTNITPSDLFPTKPLVNFATNFDTISVGINKDLLAHAVSYYNPDELEVVEKPIKKSKKKKIKQLIEKLENCEAGTEDWTEYQNVCEEILSYCFGTDLMEPMVQSATTSGHNIRDIIYQIPHDCDEFWKYIMFQFGMGIIVECKNYASPIKQNDVVITSKYFGAKKLTTFGIIFSRKPVGNSGKKGQEDAWIHNNKMIICLSDDDLIKMLELKEKREKPWKVIDNALREFRLSI